MILTSNYLRNKPIKIIKLTPQIGQADKTRKLAQAEKFLQAGEQVQIQIQLRGRQKAHPEKAVELLNDIAETLKTISKPANTPNPQRLAITFNPKRK